MRQLLSNQQLNALLENWNQDGKLQTSPSPKTPHPPNLEFLEMQGWRSQIFASLTLERLAHTGMSGKWQKFLNISNVMEYSLVMVLLEEV